MFRPCLVALICLAQFARPALAEPDHPGKWAIEGTGCSQIVLDLPPFERSGRATGTLLTGGGTIPVEAGESGPALLGFPGTEDEFLILGERDGAAIKLTGTMGPAPGSMTVGGAKLDAKKPVRLTKCADAAPPAPKITSALPDVEPLTLDSLLGDWGLYERNQKRWFGLYRSCAEHDREVVWVDFDGGRVPVYGEFKFIRAQNGELWYITTFSQHKVSDIENPNGDLVVFGAGEEMLILLRSDLHNFREGMGKRRVAPDAANKKARGGYPIEFFEFRMWDAVHYPDGAMPEGAYRVLKCIPGPTL